MFVIFRKDYLTEQGRKVVQAVFSSYEPNEEDDYLDISDYQDNFLIQPLWEYSVSENKFYAPENKYYITLNKSNIIIKVDSTLESMEENDKVVRISKELFDNEGGTSSYLIGCYYDKGTKEIINLPLEIYKALKRMHNPFIKF